jgi:hypothetical protein
MLKALLHEIKLIVSNDFAMAHAIFLRTYGIRVIGDKRFV